MIKTADNVKLLQEVYEIEHHLHNREKWLGLAGTPAAETHRADRVGGATAPFVLTSGDNTFGAWIQIMGSEDTPVESGKTLFDAHRLLVTGSNSVLPFVVQIVSGESAAIAAKITAEEFTELMYIASSNSLDSGIEDILTNRVPIGTKVWARAACIGANGTTISLYYGIHEYER